MREVLEVVYFAWLALMLAFVFCDLPYRKPRP